MPLSESRELAERPDTEDTDDAVDTERSSCGTAPRASEGVAHGSGDEARSGGGEDDVVASAMIGASRVSTQNGERAASQTQRMGCVWFLSCQCQGRGEGGCHGRRRYC
jgi:hypothetical protein